MAMITPTVDSVGDVALTNSIIDKSIAEIQDDLVTDIREHAFYNCTALKKAVFGSVSDVADRAFDGCTALTTVDFHTSTPFGDYVFNNCSALTALILRGATVCHAISGTLQNSGIASGNGYVYVPAALVDAYKAHGAWGQYASKIRAIEEWPEVCDPYSWETVAIAIEKGTYKDMYKIGDCVPVDLGSEGIINMQIAAFDADTLADGSGTAAISWVSKELLATTRRMNPNSVKLDDGTYQEGAGTTGGWGSSELRAYLNGTIKPTIPQAARSSIVAVTKTHMSADATGSLAEQTTADELWVPAKGEAYDSGGIYTGLFSSNNSRIKYPVGQTAVSLWWLRDVSNLLYFLRISTAGKTFAGDPHGAVGVCLGFCTGRTPA